MIMNKLINSDLLLDSPLSAAFWEGVILAANISPKPLVPDIWIKPFVDDVTPELQKALVSRFEVQYAHLMASDYDLFGLSGIQSHDDSPSERLTQIAEGFMSTWPLVEGGWNEAGHLPDGSVRMLQALLTTFMLIIDEEQTTQQMKDAGMIELPSLCAMQPQLNLMLNEVAHTANELMQGHQSQRVNPYKNVGRNDPCPCQSGHKFKLCCGRS